MITTLKVEGFKAVKRAEIALGRLTVLIGRNGSGKSSAIESLQWLQEALVSGLDAATTERFGRFDDLVNRLATGVGITLEWDAAGKARGHVRYGLWVKPRTAAPGVTRRPIVEHEECVVGRTVASTWVIRSRKGKAGPAVRSIQRGHPLRDGDTLALSRIPSKQSAASSFVDFLRSAVFLRLSPSSIGARATILPRARGPLLDEEGGMLVALLTGMKAPQRTRVQQRVSEVLETVTDVKVVRQGDTGYLALGERMRARGGSKIFDIPAWLLSEGTRRLTAIFVLLEAEPRPSLLAIEEIENGLDPWTLRIVFDALRDAAAEGMQILLTTHSPYLLDNVDLDQVIHVRREHGETTYHPLTEYDEVMKYRGVVAPGAMYVSDYLRNAKRRSSS